MNERHTASGSSRYAVWSGYIGLVLLLFTLWRASVNDGWDGWCTFHATLGTLGLLVWGVGRRAILRRQAQTRGVRYGVQTLTSGVLLLAVLALVNFLTARHNASFDLTESGLFTLAPQTQQVLRSLPLDVRLLAFFPAGRRAQAADLLHRYAEVSHHLRYEIVDPDQEPETAQKYGVTAYGTVVVEVAKVMGQKAGPPIRVEAEPTGQRELTLSEEKLTNALLKVVRSGAKTVYFLEGHGEGDINSTQLNGYTRVRIALENQAFVVKPLFLARQPQVPADCAVLVIAGPGQEILPDEMTALQRYLEQGGKALLLVDPAPGVGMEKFFDRWGVRVGHDLMVDVSGAGRIYGAGPTMPLVKDYNPQHPITQNFRLLTFFPLARSLTPKEMPGDAMVVPLAQTSAESFAEPYTGGDRHARFDPAHDRKGPLVPAVAVTRQAAEGKEARLVAIGSSNFISNAFFDKAGNGDFLLNAVNWLAQEEQLIALRPRPRQDHRVQLTEQQVRGTFWLTVVILPGATFLLGAFVFWRRRG